MKVIKLQAWEKEYQKKIQDIRVRELELLRRSVDRLKYVVMLRS
jgi:hypothetical protein